MPEYHLDFSGKDTYVSASVMFIRGPVMLLGIAQLRCIHKINVMLQNMLPLLASYI